MSLVGVESTGVVAGERRPPIERASATEFVENAQRRLVQINVQTESALCAEAVIVRVIGHIQDHGAGPARGILMLGGFAESAAQYDAQVRIGVAMAREPLLGGVPGQRQVPRPRPPSPQRASEESVSRKCGDHAMPPALDPGCCYSSFSRWYFWGVAART